MFGPQDELGPSGGVGALSVVAVVPEEELGTRGGLTAFRTSDPRPPQTRQTTPMASAKERKL